MPLLRIWHLFSLDAPTLAVVWCLAFAWAAGVPLSPWALVLLGMATWIAYVGDRVLDARLGRDPALLRDRHRFYGDLWRARRVVLFGSVLGAALVCLACCFALPAPIVGGYAAVSLVSLGYFAGREGAQLARPCLREWDVLFAERMQGLTLTFQQASLYGFTDMATFFKVAASPHLQPSTRLHNPLSS